MKPLTRTQFKLLMLLAKSESDADADGWMNCTPKGERPYRYGEQPTRRVLKSEGLIQDKVVQGLGYFIRVTPLGRDVVANSRPRKRKQAAQAPRETVRFVGYEITMRRITDEHPFDEPLTSGTIG